MKERIYHRLTIITCSGLSNTGKLMTQTTSQLLREDLVTFDPVFKRFRSIWDLIQEATEANHILILNGFIDSCAARNCTLQESILIFI